MTRYSLSKSTWACHRYRTWNIAINYQSLLRWIPTYQTFVHVLARISRLNNMSKMAICDSLYSNLVRWEWILMRLDALHIYCVFSDKIKVILTSSSLLFTYWISRPTHFYSSECRCLFMQLVPLIGDDIAGGIRLREPISILAIIEFGLLTMNFLLVMKILFVVFWKNNPEPSNSYTLHMGMRTLESLERRTPLICPLRLM